MLGLNEVRKWIASLGIAEDENVYIGRMSPKPEKAIGVYARAGSGSPETALGGIEYTTYETKRLSLLLHWNDDKEESEAAALNLWGKLRQVSSLTIGETHIDFLRLMVPEPQDVGPDDDGIYEYVIWMDLIYQRK